MAPGAWGEIGVRTVRALLPSHLCNPPAWVSILYRGGLHFEWSRRLQLGKQRRDDCWLKSGLSGNRFQLNIAGAVASQFEKSIPDPVPCDAPDSLLDFGHT
jgi:hypothetical protein